MTKNTATNTNQAQVSVDIEAALEQLSAEQSQIAERIAELRTLALARGTNDVTAAARAAVATLAATPANDPRTLQDRVEHAIARRALSTAELCREVRAPAGPVTLCLKRLRTAKRVYNLGTDDVPRWILRVGPDAEHRVLAGVVEAAIRERPLWLQELVAVTGETNRNRISGILAKMTVREVEPAVNLGTATKGRWFLPYPSARRGA